MSKHSIAFPVHVDGDNDIVDAEGYCVAYEGNIANYNQTMEYIATALNYHDRLVEALRSAKRALKWYKEDAQIDENEKINALLQELEQQK